MPRDRIGHLETRIDRLRDDVDQLTRTVAKQNEIVAEHRRQWLIFLEGLHPAPPRIDAARGLADLLST